jgi:rare lipoprotein A (peptidoglycan hydrolase)
MWVQSNQEVTTFETAKMNKKTMLKQITRLIMPQLLALSCANCADGESGTQQFSGNASWYGVPFHGKKTASGEIFDMNKLSGAHKTLPMMTKVMVENPKTGKSTVIKVNDRGPFVKTRVMDLSRGGAKELGYLDHGTAYLDFTVLPKSAKSEKSDAAKSSQPTVTEKPESK